MLIANPPRNDQRLRQLQAARIGGPQGIRQFRVRRGVKHRMKSGVNRNAVMRMHSPSLASWIDLRSGAACFDPFEHFGGEVGVGEGRFGSALGRVPAGFRDEAVAGDVVEDFVFGRLQAGKPATQVLADCHESLRHGSEVMTPVAVRRGGNASFFRGG